MEDLRDRRDRYGEEAEVKEVSSSEGEWVRGQEWEGAQRVGRRAGEDEERRVLWGRLGRQGDVSEGQ